MSIADLRRAGVDPSGLLSEIEHCNVDAATKPIVIPFRVFSAGQFLLIRPHETPHLGLLLSEHLFKGLPFRFEIGQGTYTQSQAWFVSTQQRFHLKDSENDPAMEGFINAVKDHTFQHGIHTLLVDGNSDDWKYFIQKSDIVGVRQNPPLSWRHLYEWKLAVADLCIDLDLFRQRYHLPHM